MNTHRLFHLLGVLTLLFSSVGVVSAQSTAFTYQGQLTDSGAPANGLFDLRFTIYDALGGGNVAGGPVDAGGVSVTNGLFTVTVDFGSAPFTGGARWLEIGVRPGASTGAYSILASRQAITATPYAIRAAEAMRVPSGAITSAMLADSAVTAAKVAPGAVSQLGSPDGSPLDAVVVDVDGRVGVGTTAPQSRLHVAGGDLLLGAGSNLTKQDSGGVERALLLYDGSDNLQLLAPPEKTLSFRTGTGGFTSVRATLTAAGRLGIGTTTPEVLVHIQNGDTGASGAISASNLQLERNSDNWLAFMSPANRLAGLAFSRPGNTATELFHGAILYNESTLPDALQFRTGGNFTRLMIDGNGEVGIGTTNPATALHVKDAAGATEISVESSDAGGHRWTLQSSGITGNSNLDASFQIIDRTLGVARLLIGTNGNVGIGITSPSAKLHVVSAAGGNGSVVLPNNSIGAAEIADEPGCAGTNFSSSGVQVTAVFPNPPSSVFSNSIVAPTPGYVLAIATMNARVVAINGAVCRWGLTSNPTNIPADAMNLVEFQPSGTSGSWSTPVTLHRLFPVSAGTTTIHVMAQEIAASWEFDKAQLSLIFLPTAYGPVPAAAGGAFQAASAEAASGEATTSGEVTSASSDLTTLLEQVRAERTALHTDLESLRQLKADLAAFRVQSAQRR
jgi:hypothetical protein